MLLPMVAVMGCSPGSARSANTGPDATQAAAASEDKSFSANSPQDTAVNVYPPDAKPPEDEVALLPDPLDRALQTWGADLSDSSGEEKPADGGAAADPPPGARAAPEADVAALSEEVKSLRIEIQRLEEILDEYLETVVKDLQQENDQLRQEVARLHGLGAEGMADAGPNVPRPGSALIAEVLGEAQAQAGTAGSAPESAKKPPSAPDPFEGEAYKVVKEWGREPDVAAQRGPNVASLKGMISAVPEGTPDEDLKALGRRLRKQFDSYDNINIEVFEGIEAAERYAKTGRGSADQRVLSVSKYPATNRDVILLIRKGLTTEVPLSE